MKALCFLSLALCLLTGCEIKSARDFNWVIIKSPLTGRCYEVAYRSIGDNSGVAMMAEISCEKL